MTVRRAAAALISATALAIGLAAAPAQAQTSSVSDPAGDASGRGLDIVKATVHNNDRAVVVRVRFVKARRGDLVVSLDQRHGEGVRLVSQLRPSGRTRSFVVPGSFSDLSRPLPCEGLKVRWNLDRARVVMRLPSRCLDGGDYGALRYAVLTERPSGGDVDYAPEKPNGDIGVSAWLPRG